MCLLLLPKRYIVAILSFLGFANIYAMRVNLSVAIAVMVANQTVIRDGNEVQEPAEFSWSTEIQGKVKYYKQLFFKIVVNILREWRRSLTDIKQF